MDTNKIKEANKLVDQLSTFEEKLEKLNKHGTIAYIELRNMGTSGHSYDIIIREHEDKEFIKVLELLIKARLTANIEKLKRQIEEI